MKLKCRLRTIRDTLKDPLRLLLLGAYTSGHLYVLVYQNEAVQILQCKDCNYQSVGYYFDPNPILNGREGPYVGRNT